MKDFEKNGLHLIVSEEGLNKKLNGFCKSLKEFTENRSEEEIEKKYNKSITNIENEFKKVEMVVNKVCASPETFIDLYTKTKSGKFSKTSKLFLYKPNLVSSLITEDYFSMDGYFLLLEPYNTSWYNVDALTEQEDIMLRQKYGENYKNSGKFIFLNLVTSSWYKPNKDFYFDKNLNVQTSSVKKLTYLSECKVGHVYENKNGKKYLCIPDVIFYLLSPRWYDRVTKYYPSKPTATCTLQWNISKGTFYDYTLSFRLGEKARGVTVDNFKQFVENSPYNATAFPKFLLLTEKVKELIKNCKTAQEVSVLTSKYGDELTYANVTQTGQMIKDLGKAFSSVPRTYVYDERRDPNITFESELPDSISYLSVSTLDTWVKKDVNKYRKKINEGFQFGRGRNSLTWGDLL